jgi:hypothetical protein
MLELWQDDQNVALGHITTLGQRGQLTRPTWLF